MPTRQECIDAAARRYALILTDPARRAELLAHRTLHQASSPASGVGEGSTSATAGLDAPRPPVAAEHHKQPA